MYYNTFFSNRSLFSIDYKQPNEAANNTAEFGGRRRNSAVDGGFGGKSLLFINNRLPKVVIESGKKFGSIIFKNNRVVTKIIF